MTTPIELEGKEHAKSLVDVATYYIVAAIKVSPEGKWQAAVSNSNLTDGAYQTLMHHIIKSLSLNLNRN